MEVKKKSTWLLYNTKYALKTEENHTMSSPNIFSKVKTPECNRNQKPKYIFNAFRDLRSYDLVGKKQSFIRKLNQMQNLKDQNSFKINPRILRSGASLWKKNGQTKQKMFSSALKQVKQNHTNHPKESNQDNLSQTSSTRQIRRNRKQRIERRILQIIQDRNRIDQYSWQRSLRQSQDSRSYGSLHIKSKNTSVYKKQVPLLKTKHRKRQNRKNYL